MATRIHFHGGPLGGTETTTPTPPPNSVGIHEPTESGGERHGLYEPDPDSAGGRCYDWQGWDR